MSKRSGGNLARTEDGSAYNKLQRPDNWPAEPARASLLDDEIEKDENGDARRAVEDDEWGQSGRTTPTTEQRKKRIYDNKKKKYNNNISASDGCLPLDDDDAFSGSENGDVSFAAIQYLKSVRAEANDLPVVSTFTLSRKRSVDDHRGYYEDGAYIVAPELGPAFPEDYEDELGLEDGEEETEPRSNQFLHLSPCEAYTNALLARFYHLRTAIQARQADPALIKDSATEGLQIPSVNHLRRSDRQSWEDTMNQKPPQPSVLAISSTESLLSLLFIIREQCMPRKRNVRKNISLWLLALLASIDERTVDSDIMHDLRSLAKKAIWLRIDHEPRFAEASEAMGREAGYISDNDGSEGQSSSDISNVEPIGSEQPEKDEILSDLIIDENVPDDATKATLDMTVTILGEVFGQRDLLESRAVVDWPLLEGVTDEREAYIEEG